MKSLKPFDYWEPASVAEAVRLLAEYRGRACVLAGGVDLIPRMRKGKTKADALVNIQRIPGLGAIEADGAGVRFGAMVRLIDLEKSEAVRKGCPALHAAIHQISSIQVKHMGTAVGNICVATPASDVATALFALDAELAVSGPNGERKETMGGFCVGYACTSMQPGEMVSGVFIPAAKPGTGAAFMNLVRTHGDIAKVGVAVSITIRGGACEDSRIAIGAAAPTVFRAVKAESVLKGASISAKVIAQAAEAAASETGTITDLRSTAEYRREMTRVLVRRALDKALGQVNKG